MEKEIKVIGDYSVFVSEDGIIRTPDTNIIRKDGKPLRRKGRILKPKINKYGYEQVTFSNNGIRKTYLTHRLVALAFIPKVQGKETVNHKDGNKLNNSYENLEWADNKDQKVHAISHGLCDKNIKVLKMHNESKSIAVEYNGKTYTSLNECKRETGLHPSTIKKYGKVVSQ